MSKNVEFHLDKAGVNQLLHSSGARSLVEQHARNQVSRAGEGYTYDVRYSSKDGRVTAYVHSETKKAEKDNSDNNTLLKSTQG